jgi:hypothetical protein
MKSKSIYSKLNYLHSELGHAKVVALMSPIRFIFNKVGNFFGCNFHYHGFNIWDYKIRQQQLPIWTYWDTNIGQCKFNL